MRRSSVIGARTFALSAYAVLATVVLAAAFVVIPAKPAEGAAYSGYSLAQARDIILAKTNAARTAQGLKPLMMNSRLNDVAQAWSEQQARDRSMAHNPSYSAQYPGGWSRAAENVAYGYGVNDVVNAWLNSSGHRKNILDPGTNYIGIGLAIGGSQIYYTQNFATYSSPPPGTNSSGVPKPVWSVSVERLAGADRYKTAVAVSRKFSSGVGTLYIASGENYPDALSAAPAAVRGGAPLLLTPSRGLTAEVKKELERLRPATIVVAGGPSVVSDAVYRQLAAYAPSIRRDAGADRYATSRLLVERAWSGAQAPVVYLATGQNFPDALSAASAAGAQSAPVVLVRSLGPDSGLDRATRDLLKKLGTTKVFIAGSESVVSKRIASELTALLGSGSVQRFAGSNRYDTSLLAARSAATQYGEAFIATGTGFADALAGAALAGARGAPMYLAQPGCVPASTFQEITGKGVKKVILLGSEGALSAHVAAGIRC